MMGEIAELADFAVITSDKPQRGPRDIIRDILAGVGDGITILSWSIEEEKSENTVVNAKKGDIIILAGKGHETYEINRAGRFPFNEKEIAQAAARQRFNG